MRSIDFALATALVALTAGTAAAQQTPASGNGQFTIQLGGVQMGGNGGGTIVMSSNGGTPVVLNGDGTAAEANSLEGIALTAAQKESLAKLDAEHAKAIAAADAQHTAAVRALLTDAQRAKFDQNVANRKAEAEAAQRSMQNAVQGIKVKGGQGGTMMFQIQGNVKADSAKK